MSHNYPTINPKYGKIFHPSKSLMDMTKMAIKKITVSQRMMTNKFNLKTNQIRNKMDFSKIASKYPK